VPVKAGILTLNNDIANSISEVVDKTERYRSFESIRGDAYNVLLIDSEYFEGEEAVHSSLSRRRKKAQ